MRRPPFDILRACFMLLATVVLIIMVETMGALIACAWVVVVTKGDADPGCTQIGARIHEVMTELLTAILALLAASRGGPPPTDGEK